MNYYYYNGEIYSQDELCHYGVLGMKWGVRKDPSKAYRKATRKADKLDKKAVKLGLKAGTSQKKAFKAKTKLLKTDTESEDYEARQDKANKLEKKYVSLNSKYSKTLSQAKNWTSSMEKAFRNVKLSDISQEDLDAGRRYSYMLLKE